MRARAIAGGIVSSAAVLVIGWQIGSAQVSATTNTGTPVAGSPSGSSTGGSAPSTSQGTSATTPSSAPSTGKPSAGSGTASGTFTGATSQTQYGPVQVEIVVGAGKITDVKALQLTDDGGRSVQISNYAAPMLRTEALSAQSAKIQAVSGATFTSQGYISSLQSAIDKAGL